MKEKLIEYKTAKLAEEKGFDLETEECYVETPAQFNVEYNRDGDTTDFPYKPPHLKTLKYLDYPEILLAYAPTQSLLQKWLREKHNIDVLSLSIRFCGYNEIGYWTYSVKSIQPVGKDLYKYDTYEEALEDGLLNGLKLINK